MRQQQYEDALKAILKLGDELLEKTRYLSREEKMWHYVQHADAVEDVVREALKK